MRVFVYVDWRRSSYTLSKSTSHQVHMAYLNWDQESPPTDSDCHMERLCDPTAIIGFPTKWQRTIVRTAPLHLVLFHEHGPIIHYYDMRSLVVLLCHHSSVIDWRISSGICMLRSPPTVDRRYICLVQPGHTGPVPYCQKPYIIVLQDYIHQSLRDDRCFDCLRKDRKEIRDLVAHITDDAAPCRPLWHNAGIQWPLLWGSCPVSI